MNLLPLRVFLGSVACAAIFEYVYGFICHRLRVILDKDLWVFLYWASLGMLGMLCGVIPPFHLIGEWKDWIPMVFVMGVHCISACMGYDSAWMFFEDSDPELHDTIPRNSGTGGNPEAPCEKGHKTKE